MPSEMNAGLVSAVLVVLLACGGPADGRDTRSPSASAAKASDGTTADARKAPSASAPGPAAKPGGGLVAEPSGVDGHLSIEIRWSATTVKGIPAEGQITEVYKRTAQLECPITSSDEASYSYFAAFDNPNGDPMAATGSYQPWWNEECTGTLTVDDTYHFNDPTTAGPEPVIPTTGTRPLKHGRHAPDDRNRPEPGTHPLPVYLPQHVGLRAGGRPGRCGEGRIRLRGADGDDGLHPRRPHRRRQARNRGAGRKSLDRVGVHARTRQALARADHRRPGLALQRRGVLLQAKVLPAKVPADFPAPLRCDLSRGSR